ncbi:MAG: radical SAM protein, partial [Pyrinomonadaceae bacterium]
CQFKPRPNLVDLTLQLSRRMLAHCNFCRFDCQIDRTQGSRFGACKLAEESRVSSYFHHLGEELIYRGHHGSGTIFFSSCNMRCAFCQNGDISTDKDNGEVVSPRTLATMAWLLRMEGCHNINWVGGDPTIHLHTIVEAISLLDELSPTVDDLKLALPVKSDYFVRFRPSPEHAYYQGAFNAPMLWNSNFYMSAPAMKILRLLMDVWLPDFKFGPEQCAVTLSKTPWYWETVTGNIKMIHDWGEDFTIRHLIMPNHVECCTLPVLQWVAETMPEVPVNIMDQFHPDNFCDPGNSKYNAKYQAISRRPTSREVLQAFRYAKELGVRFESLSYEKNTTGLRV